MVGWFLDGWLVLQWPAKSRQRGENINFVFVEQKWGIGGKRKPFSYLQLGNRVFYLLFVPWTMSTGNYLQKIPELGSLDSNQRLGRWDRRPRALFCCRQLAKFRIVRGICLYNALLWPVCYKPTGQCSPDCGVLGYCRFWIKAQDFMGWNLWPRGICSWRRKKFKIRIYIIIPIFPSPIISDWCMGWRGCVS